MTKQTKVISGFPGVGKSFLFSNQDADVTIHDSDSSKFSWIREGVRNPDFPKNYIQHIQDHVGKVDLLFVSSHEVVRKALEENNIPYTLVYPAIELKSEYLNRYKARGSSLSFINFIDANWERFITDIEQETFPQLIQLNKGEFLADVLAECHNPKGSEEAMTNEIKYDAFIVEGPDDNKTQWEFTMTEAQVNQFKESTSLPGDFTCIEHEAGILIVPTHRIQSVCLELREDPKGSEEDMQIRLSNTKRIYAVSFWFKTYRVNPHIMPDRVIHVETDSVVENEIISLALREIEGVYPRTYAASVEEVKE